MFILIRTCADGEFNPDSLGNEHRRAVQKHTNYVCVSICNPDGVKQLVFQSQLFKR